MTVRFRKTCGVFDPRCSSPRLERRREVAARLLLPLWTPLARGRWFCRYHSLQATCLFLRASAKPGHSHGGFCPGELLHPSSIAQDPRRESAENLGGIEVKIRRRRRVPAT